MTAPRPRAAPPLPVEAVEDAAPAGLAETGRGLALGTLTAAALGSKALAAWANDLPISPASDFLLYVAQAWQDMAGALWLTRYAEAVHALLRLIEGLR